MINNTEIFGNNIPKVIYMCHKDLLCMDISKNLWKKNKSRV